jgi:hypothetical protein
MENLINALIEQDRKDFAKFVENINDYKEINLLLSVYRRFIPSSSKGKKWDSIEQLREYIIKRCVAENQKELNLKIQKVKEVFAAPDVVSINISVEWKKSSTWGSNPTATAEIRLSDGSFERFVSGSITGCGFDKESTATAEALNQSNSVLKLLYAKKDSDITKSNRELIGYGSGYYVLPNFEGGVGFDCHRRIFEGFGFEVENSGSGKSFDVYRIARKDI